LSAIGTQPVGDEWAIPKSGAPMSQIQSRGVECAASCRAYKRRPAGVGKMRTGRTQYAKAKNRRRKGSWPVKPKAPTCLVIFVTLAGGGPEISRKPKKKKGKRDKKGPTMECEMILEKKKKKKKKKKKNPKPGRNDHNIGPAGEKGIGAVAYGALGTDILGTLINENRKVIKVKTPPENPSNAINRK